MKAKIISRIFTLEKEKPYLEASHSKLSELAGMLLSFLALKCEALRVSIC